MRRGQIRKGASTGTSRRFLLLGRASARRIGIHALDEVGIAFIDHAAYEKIKRFVLLPNPFTLESGELTNTLTIKRRVVYDRYADRIERM